MTQRDELPIEIELVRGATYVPSNAVNPTQMWTEFDPVTIDRELGFAEELGLNSARVFIQYLAYEYDAHAFLAHFETFLDVADRHGLSVMPVLFDDCWLPEPLLGEQALEPRPRLHNPYWQRSPGERRKELAFGRRSGATWRISSAGSDGTGGSSHGTCITSR